MRQRLCLAPLTLAALFGLAHAALAADPDALWKIVSDKCVPNAEQHADPKPCALVDLHGGVDQGYVVLKDLVGATQYLLIPTAKLTGIESPALLAAGAPNYFADAWRERRFTARAAQKDLPRDAISLAINAASGRTQNQLHIHIDCIRSDVRDAVQHQLAQIGDDWAPFPEPLAGHQYRAMRVVGDELAPANPFVLLAGGVPGARAAMGSQTLVVVGADFGRDAPGFVILNDQADPAAGDRGSGEELQDHSCALAHG